MAQCRLIEAALSFALVASCALANADGHLKDHSGHESEQTNLAAAHEAHGTFIVKDLHQLTHWLQTCRYQELIALCALLAGLFSVIESNIFFQGTGVLIFALTAGVLAQSEAVVYWGSDLNAWVQFLIFVEVAAMTVFASLTSPRGFQCVYGFFIGLVLAYLHAGWAMIRAWDSSKGAMWYAACAALGAVTLVIGEKTASAVAGPILGGLLVASASNFFVSNIGFSESKDTEPWIDCVNDLLISPTNTYDFGEGATYTARSLGLCLWAVVALIGISRYFCGCPYIEKFDDEETGLFKALRNPLLSEDDRD